MDAVAILRNRIDAIGSSIAGLVRENGDLDWSRPLLPGTSPLGLTLWHLPRTLDWLINTTIRGVTEVADEAAFADLPDPDAFGFGTGLTPDQAAQAASIVRAEPSRARTAC